MGRQCRSYNRPRRFQLNSVPFSFDDPLTKPTDTLPHSYEHQGMDVSHPPQTPDGDEYICGDSGPAFPGNNPGRDQDRSRADEYVGAAPFARYVG
jgi:hypothetical protein